MEELMRLNSLSTGRDKLLRLWQFSCRLYWGTLIKRGRREDSDLVRKLKELELLLGITRRFLRFGRGMDMFYTTSGGISVQNSLLGTIISLSRISSAFYLLADHVLLLEKIGFVQADDKKWADISNRFLFLSSFLLLVRDLHEIQEILTAQQGKATKNGNLCGFNDVRELIANHKAVSVDTLKNFCDTLIALTYLGHCYIGPGKLGFLGVLSSVAGIVQMVNPSYRLVPS